MFLLPFLRAHIDYIMLFFITHAVDAQSNDCEAVYYDNAKRYGIKPLPFALIKQLLENSNCYCIYVLYIDLKVVT